MRPGLVVPDTQRIADHGETVTQIADRVTTAYRALTCLAENQLSDSAVELRRPGKSEERSEVVPIVVVQPLTRVAAYEIKCSDCRSGSGRGIGIEQISETRHAENMCGGPSVGSPGHWESSELPCSPIAHRN